MRWRKKRYWIPIVVIILIAAIGGTQGGKKTPTSATTTAATADTIAASSPTTSPTVRTVPKTLAAARSYISHHAHDINTVRVMIQSVQAGVVIAQKSATQDVVYELAQLAQQAHDAIDNVRSDFALNASDSGALGDAETEVFVAANGLKNSMGALVAYTGDPTPATLAHFTSQYQPALAEWNDGVRIIWRMAHHQRPPIL